MEYKNLKILKKTKNPKRILLVNPRRPTCQVNIPHMGLAILSSILKLRGHEVLVVDYQLTHNAPDIVYFIKEFKPDAVGVSIATANTIQAEELIEKIRKNDKKVPILTGGPHATLYPEHIQKNSNIDYIVIGEAEPIIIDLVEKAKRERKTRIIQSKIIVNPDNLPYGNYKTFYKWQYIRSYPIMTSRGCPYHCSFCPVAYIGQKKWRPRNPEDCIKELEIAKKELNPYLHVLIQDDNPLVIPEHFYKFLELFAKEIKLRIDITNMRADDINERLLKLLRLANCTSVGLGVESGNQEVFKLINKGETLETIENAAKLIKKYKMLLSFCFVIGLPKDNLERVKDSIKLAKKYNPDTIYWNMVIPYKNTAIRTWFEKNGTIYNEIGKTSLSDGDFRCDEPCVETPEFTKFQRKQAHYLALFRTADDRLKIKNFLQIYKEAKKYRLLNEFIFWLPNGIVKSLKRKSELIVKFLKYSKREGVEEAIKRSLFLIKEN